jgi:FkbM family methyltransferase
MPKNHQHDRMRRTADLLSIALNHTPRFPGRYRFTDAIARMVASKGTGWGTCSPGNGALLRVNLGDRIERQMWGGCYEPHVQQSLRNLLSPGDVFIDIGAHIGYHAVLGATLVGTGGQVFAFEADPGNFARLRDHLRPFPSATAVNKAAWSSTGAVTFERSSEFGESGWGTLTTVRDLGRGAHLSVDTISLDQWLSESNLGCVSAMKVDAEGSEVAIFRGATELLERMRPSVIFEANDVVLRQANTSALELTEILHEQSYALFDLHATSLKRLCRGRQPQCSELIAIPNERVQAVLAQFKRSGFRVESPA